MTNTVMSKLIKNSTIKLTAPLLESEVYGKKEMYSTDVPLLNIALSGRPDGGLMPGILQLAGKSKHFKSAFSLVIAAAFQKKKPNGVILFYDSEFGTTYEYFKNFNVDMNRVVHTPITNVEELKFDIANQLKNIEKGDDIIIIVDSVGNLASLKEVEDAENQNSVADMSRAKQLKSLFRIVTPHLNLKDIPMIVVNHTYDEISKFPKAIVSGGTGAYYSSNDIWIIGRQQEKDGKELLGYNFIINIEKSRTVQEGAKLPIQVTFDGGINRWSGLFDLALEFGMLLNPKMGWYQVPGEEKMRRRADIEADDGFFVSLLENKEFRTNIETNFAIHKEEADDESTDVRKVSEGE